ncbi:MAG: YcaQ family DNA glycosylase [Dehalococcoidia bacterium]|nr:YcaQ family DNA glycosylase [Dehalococcoidia bacterium]
MLEFSASEARRIALNAQGFGSPRPKKAGIDEMKAVVDRLRLIQIDSVNVCVRAHYMPFFSRLGPYDQSLLEKLAYEEQYLFEQWGHAACYIPTDDYPMFAHRMAQGWRWYGRPLTAERTAYFESILDEVRERGPVVTGEMDGEGRQKGWWGWSHAKLALEYQFAHGRLAVKERRNFARVYDLAERVFPHLVSVQPLAAGDAHREMVRKALRAMGVATAKDIADYYHLKIAEVRVRLPEVVDTGEAEPVRVEAWNDPAYLWHEAEHEAPGHATALLSPFDNLIWAPRGRSERLFDFSYTIELYTPAEKRVYGYYVLPFMHEGRLVGRVDLKANRQAGTLEVRASHLEPGAPEKKTARALAKELRTMARWLSLERMEVWPAGSLAAALAGAVGQAGGDS